MIIVTQFMENIKEILKDFHKVLFLIVLFIFLGISFSIFGKLETNNSLTVKYLDIGQGDATLIITPDGSKTLIDAGPNDTVTQEIDKLISIVSRNIDNLLLTHPDLDHVGGTKTVLNRFSPKNLLISSENSYEEYGVYAEKINNTQNIKIGKVLLEILAPGKGQFGNSNHNAIVSQIKYGNFKFIFMADADLEIERNLVSQGHFKENRYINILKVGHHGSDTSSSEVFLKAIKPKYCIISVGKDNKYGHPKQMVLDRLTKYCGEIYRTDQDGGVEFRVKGTSLYISKDS
jgi:beta-lactamase superfamily II metal-dependent hydrolase